VRHGLPVGINTGDLTKRFRRLRHPQWAHRVACRLGGAFCVAGTRDCGLACGRATQSSRSWVPGRWSASPEPSGHSSAAVPAMEPEMPRPASGRPPTTQQAGAQAVYFPACISRVMGHLPGEADETSLMAAFVTVAWRAGKPVVDSGGCRGGLLRRALLCVERV